MKRTLSGLLSLLIVLTLFTPFSIVFAEEDGRNDRLNHIVQKMGNTADDEHGIYRALYHLGITLDFITY